MPYLIRVRSSFGDQFLDAYFERTSNLVESFWHARARQEAVTTLLQALKDSFGPGWPETEVFCCGGVRVGEFTSSLPCDHFWVTGMFKYEDGPGFQDRATRCD
jgi:hypothetical protein